MEHSRIFQQQLITAKKIRQLSVTSFMSMRYTLKLLLISCIIIGVSSENGAVSTDQCQSRSCYPNTGNLLIGRERQLSSTSTCGVRHPEVYCIVSHLEDRKKCFKCDSTSEWMAHINERSHRVENVIHDNLNQQENVKQRSKKWWQSENGVQNVSIRLDLEAEFHFTHLIMTFKSFRPAAMVVERSADYGRTWKIYRHFAYDCAESFPNVPEATTPREHGDIFCDSRYSRVEPSTGGEVVLKILSPHITTNDPFAPKIQDLLRMTNLRINFTKLHTLGDNLLDNRPEISEKYYYAIYDMVVRGSCSCYGHAEHCIPTENNAGVSFVPNRIADVVYGRCQCTHHTKGMNCEDCEDFYNDLPWQPAREREINACKRCNCNNHASRCHFDRAVYNESGFVTGGVCDDCQHNTMGKNCERCKPYFFLDPNRNIDDPYACRPCECDIRGSKNNGTCDSRNEGDLLKAGRCRCKTNVDGPRCDRCKVNHWDLSESNPEGCTLCTCDKTGTYRNEGCNKYTGECTCKRLVTGENCDKCLPEHYGLSQDVDDGCKPCDCDIGGAFNNSCDILMGQCRCRENFGGRRCDQPASEYYCAPLDFYTYEAEDSQLTAASTIELREPASFETSRPTYTGNGFAKVREGGTIEFTIDNINLGMYFHVVIRYESQLVSVWENVDVMLIRPGNPDPNGPCKEYSTRNDFMRAVLYPRGRYYEIAETVCLESGVSYQLKISLGNYRTGYNDRTAFLLFDSIVLVPALSSLSIFNDGTPAADYRRREFEDYQCKHAVLDLTALDRLPEVCHRYYCPLAASLVEKGIMCDCNVDGSNSRICTGKGGQCICKPMVVGRRCDRCAPGTFGFGRQGCSACECNSIGSLDNFCDLRSGQCKCNDGVWGRQCDQCQPGFWGFPSCKPCQCNGHADICDQEIGACIDCRNLTTSHYCDRCKDGYYGDPRLGVSIPCKACECPGGVAKGYQHADTCYLHPTAQNQICNCRLGYIGDKCDKCDLNYWGNPNEVGGSCEKCECSNNIDNTVPESCDPKDGRCTKCLYNTEGFFCENCVAGYFGDAKIQSCRNCACNPLGTNAASGPCDRVSGQCQCFDRVQGIECDRCEQNYWKLASASGCEACDCDEDGVLLDNYGQRYLQCNEFDGQCQCKPERGGRTCRECQNYYWGSPRDGCKKCECNDLGSQTFQCHRENGTCICRQGYGGARCDECARGYTGTWPNCEPCGECFQNWDKILTKLKEETSSLVAQAGNIEATGVASVYDKEFSDMEAKLASVQEQLNTANISRQEVDELNERIKSLETLLGGARDKFTSTETKTTQTDADVQRSATHLDLLKTRVSDLAGEVAEYEQNATKLREADAEGAYNITKEAYESSLDSIRRANATDTTTAEADSIRRRTSDTLGTFESEFVNQFEQNQESLDKLNVSIAELNGKIPNLNNMVCGAPGDPCHPVCGGAGCGKCGADSCGEGALTKSGQAYQYSKEANEKLQEKQQEAHDMVQRLRTAQENSESAFGHAKAAYEVSLRNAQKANQTRNDLANLLDRVNSFLNGEGATVADIRVLAETIMNMTISENPSDIERLGAEISENLGKLTNIDTILEETRNNLTLAEQLKKRADAASLRAETILNTTDGVIDALLKANTAQTKAQEAIDQADSDINGARDDLNTISEETELAELAANQSSEGLAKLQSKLNDVEVSYLRIDKHVDRVKDTIDKTLTNVGQVEMKRQNLEERYKSAQDILDQKLGDSQPSTPVDRAERLSRKAGEILAKTDSYLTQIEQHTKDFANNEYRLTKSAEDLTDLHRRLDLASKDIQRKLDHYKTCG